MKIEMNGIIFGLFLWSISELYSFFVCLSNKLFKKVSLILFIIIKSLPGLIPNNLNQIAFYQIFRELTWLWFEIRSLNWIYLFFFRSTFDFFRAPESWLIKVTRFFYELSSIIWQEESYCKKMNWLFILIEQKFKWVKSKI